MTITIPIPPSLIEQFEAFAMECSGLLNWELVFPPHHLYLEAREALFNSPEFSSLIHFFGGPVYINMKAGTITGILLPKGKKKEAPIGPSKG
jgi:hypothetical protein